MYWEEEQRDYSCVVNARRLSLILRDVCTGRGKRRLLQSLTKPLRDVNYFCSSLNILQFSTAPFSLFGWVKIEDEEIEMENERIKTKNGKNTVLVMMGGYVFLIF